MLQLLLLGKGALGATLLHVGRRYYQQRQRRRSALSTAPALTTTTQRPQEIVSISPEEQETNHYLKISTVGVGATYIGEFIYAPLLVPAVALMLYSSIPIFQNASFSLRKRKMKASIVDSVAIVGALATQYYLASAIASLVYFSSQKLLLKTEEKSKKRLSNIFGKQPRSVWMFKEGVEIEIPFVELQVGDVIALHAGEMIPVDGKVIGGNASVDQHMMTGEAQPVEKTEGDTVLAGTLLVSGTIRIEVQQCGEETVAAKIGEILQNTADFRFSVEAQSVRLADRMVIPTLALGTVGLVTLGPVSGVALVSCNFSEVIRVVAPIGVLNFIKLSAEHGILVKDGRSLELLDRVDTVVFDKTGTLTLEQPHVSKLHVWGHYNEAELLTFAAAAEYRQSHPIAKAILQAAHERALELPVIEQSKYDVGYGIKVEVGDKIVRVGSYRFMQMQVAEHPSEADQLQQLGHDHGYSIVYVAVNDQVIGAIELHATIRPEAKEVVTQLRQRGLTLYIISGDHEKPTRHLAKKLGIQHYFAETLPEHKAQRVEQLQQEGRSVCFIGDGINDAIALKKAHVSISLQGASSAATDSAGILLMDKNLTKLPYLFELSRGLNKNIKSSFTSAIVPGIIGISGVFLLRFGIYSTLLLYITSFATGTANAMLPLWKYRTDKEIK